MGLTDGSGAAVFGPGTALPLAFPSVRLVVNAGRENEIIGHGKRLEVLGATIEPAAPVEVPADSREQAIALSSDAHLERSLEAHEPQAAQVNWEVVGSGGSITPNPTRSTGGRFETRLTTATTAGATYQVRASLAGGAVVATTGLVTVTPGRARDVTLVADRTSLPADEASEALVTLTARDQFGNPVADGTLVSWGVAGAGRVAATATVTAGGVTSVRYRAGDAAGTATVVARVDGVEVGVEIGLAALHVAVLPEAGTVTANAAAPVAVLITVASAAGPPDAAAELVVQATLGRLEAPAHLVNGQASAAFTPLGLTGEARLLASVATHTGQAALNVVRPAGLYVTPAPPLVIGDRTEDGTVEIAEANGGMRVFTYRTATTLTVTGNPGDVVDLALGGTRSPNVEPMAWYSMDELDGDTVLDAYGDHPGRSFGGVSVLRRAK